MEKTNFFNETSLLGLGAMRLPLNKTGIDFEELNLMIDTALDKGINYFDTAYVYHGGESEIALRKSLVERHDRSSYYLADKLSCWIAKDSKDVYRVFNEQISRLGVSYIDYYLIHSLDREKFNYAEKVDAFNFVKEKKEEGIVKHIGFSFHGDPELLEEILIKYPEMEFVQLQINYLDWDLIRSKECYEIAKKYNKPIIIMEPLKGGTLAVMPEQIEEIFKKTSPDRSTVSWAFRFLKEKEGIMTILSGMSNLEQIKENIQIFSERSPLSNEEKDTLDEVLVEYAKLSTIPCTACKYCIDCPKEIDIASVFGTYNQFKRSEENSWNARMLYRNNIKVKADKCIECGLCESHCPQSIKIIEELKVCHNTLG